jgi:hypothetical protein
MYWTISGWIVEFEEGKRKVDQVEGLGWGSVGVAEVMEEMEFDAL